MKKIVAGKKERRREAKEADATPPTEDNVVSFMEALKSSVAADRDKRNGKS
jgi:non-homologous end joining protein Ku